MKAIRVTQLIQSDPTRCKFLHTAAVGSMPAKKPKWMQASALMLATATLLPLPRAHSIGMVADAFPTAHHSLPWHPQCAQYLNRPLQFLVCNTLRMPPYLNSRLRPSPPHYWYLPDSVPSCRLLPPSPSRPRHTPPPHTLLTPAGPSPASPRPAGLPFLMSRCSRTARPSRRADSRSSSSV